MKYIIFIDGSIKGYLDDLNSAKDIIQRITEKIIRERREQKDNKETTNQTIDENINKLRIFTEQTETGINIYLQELGKYINGAVQLVNTIEYKPIEKLELNNLE